MKTKKFTTSQLTILGLMAGILFLMAYTPLGYLNIGPLAVTFNVIPVAVCAIVLGPTGGAIAGAVFGLTSFMQAIGIGGVSALGSALFQINPFMTAVQCFGPRILDGICIGFIYRAVHKKANTYVSCAVTGFFSAFLNTLFFMTALIVMFGNTELIRNLMGGHNIIVGCCLMVGVNAISEMVSSTIITAAVGTALSKAHLIPAVQIVKTDTAKIKILQTGMRNMILAIDIGNTNIVVGCIDKEKIYFTERISTIRTKTELEYAIDIKTILDIHHINRADIEGAIISSVVPQITSAARLAVQKILKKDAMILGPGVKTGLNIMLDNPGEMGADRVADAVAALAQYPVPLVIIDMGTATTISVVDDKKHYIGGMIMPGVQISLDALTTRASQLSGISIEEPKKIIGKNTVDCMKSGVLYGNAAAVDGIIDRIEEELGQKVTVIATGGMSRKIIPHCKRKMILDGDLLLKGLQIVYEKNKA